MVSKLTVLASMLALLTASILAITAAMLAVRANAFEIYYQFYWKNSWLHPNVWQVIRYMLEGKAVLLDIHGNIHVIKAPGYIGGNVNIYATNGPVYPAYGLLPIKTLKPVSGTVTAKLVYVDVALPLRLTIESGVGVVRNETMIVRAPALLVSISAGYYSGVCYYDFIVVTVGDYPLLVLPVHSCGETSITTQFIIPSVTAGISESVSCSTKGCNYTYTTEWYTINYALIEALYRLLNNGRIVYNGTYIVANNVTVTEKTWDWFYNQTPQQFIFILPPVAPTTHQYTLSFIDTETQSQLIKIVVRYNPYPLLGYVIVFASGLPVYWNRNTTGYYTIGAYGFDIVCTDKNVCYPLEKKPLLYNTLAYTIVAPISPVKYLHTILWADSYPYTRIHVDSDVVNSWLPYNLFSPLLDYSGYDTVTHLVTITSIDYGRSFFIPNLALLDYCIIYANETLLGIFDKIVIEEYRTNVIIPYSEPGVAKIGVVDVPALEEKRDLSLPLLTCTCWYSLHLFSAGFVGVIDEYGHAVHASLGLVHGPPVLNDTTIAVVFGREYSTVVRDYYGTFFTVNWYELMRLVLGQNATLVDVNGRMVKVTPFNATMLCSGWRAWFVKAEPAPGASIVYDDAQCEIIDVKTGVWSYLSAEWWVLNTTIRCKKPVFGRALAIGVDNYPVFIVPLPYLPAGYSNVTIAYPLSIRTSSSSSQSYPPLPHGVSGLSPAPAGVYAPVYVNKEMLYLVPSDTVTPRYDILINLTLDLLLNCKLEVATPGSSVYRLGASNVAVLAVNASWLAEGSKDEIIALPLGTASALYTHLTLPQIYTFPPLFAPPLHPRVILKTLPTVYNASCGGVPCYMVPGLDGAISTVNNVRLSVFNVTDAAVALYNTLYNHTYFDQSLNAMVSLTWGYLDTSIPIVDAIAIGNFTNANVYVATVEPLQESSIAVPLVFENVGYVRRYYPGDVVLVAAPAEYIPLVLRYHPVYVVPPGTDIDPVVASVELLGVPSNESETTTTTTTTTTPPPPLPPAVVPPPVVSMPFGVEDILLFFAAVALVTAVLAAGAELSDAALHALIPFGIALVLLGKFAVGVVVATLGLMAYLLLRRS